MKKCSICNKNIAMIYTTKYDGKENTTIGICASCAREMNIPALNEILDKSDIFENLNNMGIDMENIDIDELNDQVNEFTKNLNPDDMKNMLEFMSGDKPMDENLTANLLEIFNNQNKNDDEYDEDEQFDDENEVLEITENSNDTENFKENQNDENSSNIDNIVATKNEIDDADIENVENSDKNIDAEKIQDDSETSPTLSKNDAKKKLEDIFNNIVGTQFKSSKKSNDKKEEDPRYKKRPERKKRKNLEKFGNYLFDKIENLEIDSIVGRDDEIQRIMNILCRRSKNNPVLIGEPGVGKTAVSEGLAIKIYEGKVPSILAGKEIYDVDITAILAGTQLRGQFESRLLEIVKEAKNSKNIILIIDEIHKLIGAGDPTSGSMDAANILKPALSKGDIQVIGTTTLEEYRKHIEKDPALERRFQPVFIDEPSEKDSIEIIKGIKHYYEDFHKIIIPDETVEQAVKLSKRYVPDRFLPDKAIDVIDEAGAMLNLKHIDRKTLKELKNELTNVIAQKEEASLADNFEVAAKHKVREIELTKRIENNDYFANEIVLGIDDVGKIIESWTKIPVNKVTKEEAQKLLDLENSLKNSIIGQEDAVKAVSKAIRRSRAGFRKQTRPASFIFVGPTGVGKTELAKKLAYEMFGSEDNLIRLDMSEYMEAHAVSKMIGSPPGYVGYDQGGQLTTLIRRNPYSVILLDEIEKAHSDVYNMLLQILDDGRLTDSQGRVVHFENSIIIMTSNAGSNEKTATIGFGNDKLSVNANKAKTALKQNFRPEFLNRIDDIIVFNSLSKENVRKIVDLQLEMVFEEANEKLIDIKIDDKVKDYLADIGYDELYGARPLKREIQKLIEDEMAERYLKGEIAKDSQLFITLAPNAVDLCFDIQSI